MIKMLIVWFLGQAQWYECGVVNLTPIYRFCTPTREKAIKLFCVARHEDDDKARACITYFLKHQNICEPTHEACVE